jgi:hypothetical protein
MLKLRVSLGLALVAAFLTAAVALVQGARPLTILYRTAVSLGGFLIGGYLAATLIQLYLGRRLAGVKPQGKNIDIVSKEGIISNDELITPPPEAAPKFSPFVPESFEQVTAKD